jgi:hypothetical protein
VIGRSTSIARCSQQDIDLFANAMLAHKLFQRFWT